MNKIISLFLVCSVFMITLTGCFDAKEVTEWSYVYSIGMEHGIKDKLRMSVQIPSMKGGTGGGDVSSGSSSNITSEESQGIVTITIDCPSFYSGINMVNTFLSRELNYMHTKFLVFSEKLAKEGIETYINAFARGRQIRRQLYILVSRESASEFLKANLPSTSSSLTKSQESMMDQAKNTGLFGKITYGEVTDSMKTPYAQPIATLVAVNNFNNFEEGEGSGKVSSKTSVQYYAGQLPRKGGGKVEFLGTAVFDGGKMVEELNGEESRAMLMARGEFRRGNFALQDPLHPKSTVTIDVRSQKKRKVKVKLNENKPVVNLNVYLEGDILAIQSTIDYESKEMKPLLEGALKNQIKKNLETTIEKCQKIGADVFEFGLFAGMKFGTIQEFEQYNWLDKFKNAKVNVEVDFTIRRTGTMLKSSEIISSEGKEAD